VITLEGSVRSSNSGAKGLKQTLQKTEQKRDKVNNRKLLRLKDHVNSDLKIPLISTPKTKKAAPEKAPL